MKNTKIVGGLVVIFTSILVVFWRRKHLMRCKICGSVNIYTRREAVLGEVIHRCHGCGHKVRT